MPMWAKALGSKTLFNQVIKLVAAVLVVVSLVFICPALILSRYRNVTSIRYVPSANTDLGAYLFYRTKITIIRFTLAGVWAAILE